MKIIKRIALAILAIIILCLGGGYFFMQSLKPTYKGSLTLEGLNSEVNVYFDDYGVPHIFADNEPDAYFALGYVHGQDRLFQMEMLRRVGNGQLAEILGPDLVKTDRFFRTIGIRETTKKATAAFQQLDANDPMKKATLAYYEGLNQFIKNGPTPVEFYILGIEKRPFSIEDAFSIFGYMGFSFAQAFRTDPLVTRIQEKYGSAYLQDLDVHWNPIAQKIPVFGQTATDSLLSNYFGIDHLFESLPTPPWIGSNSWVLGPSKTKSGKVLFSNDTHIAYAQPSVWYDAHIECPELSLFGQHLGGIPFAVTGHNRYFAWGLTMLENDDIDFYVEEFNPDNDKQVRFKDQWEDVEVRQEVIKVKGGEDVVFEVKTTRHGPIVNDAIDHVANTTNQPVSMWWIYNNFLPKNLESVYTFGRAQSMQEARKGVAMGHAPGLNVMYGDMDGNIAWWAMGKLPKRPAHVNSKLLLDGASGNDEILGYFDFEDNPQSENPPSGYVYSANNQPDTSAGTLHAGYYIPEDRAKRIVEQLNSDKKWNLEDAKALINDTKSSISPTLAKEIVHVIGSDVDFSSNEKQALEILNNWDGHSPLEAVAPTIYAKVLYHVLSKTMKDELGEEDFETFLSTHLIKRTLTLLLQRDASLWWDNINTSDQQETRKSIFTDAFQQSIQELEAQLGQQIDQWNWEKVHTIEHPHALSQVPALRSIFNVGPFPINGNNETLNNQMFRISGDGEYEVVAGPAMRRIIDFSDVEHSLNVLPTGQSGNVLSPHYDDQAQLFVDGKFRVQLMNKEEIKAQCKRKLVLKGS